MNGPCGCLPVAVLLGSMFICRALSSHTIWLPVLLLRTHLRQRISGAHLAAGAPRWIAGAAAFAGSLQVAPPNLRRRF
jgi:hypothetical protein